MKNFQQSILIRLFTVAIIGVMVSSCVRVEGPAGPSGQDGRDGNANVISINYEVFDNDWFDVGTPGEDEFYLALDLDVPEITQDIVNDGLVLAYYRPDDQSPWIALPYTLISHNPSYIEKLDFIYDFGFAGFQSQATDKNATPWAGIFRIVIASAIPVNKMAVDYSNYDEVASWLNITDTNQEYRKK